MNALEQLVEATRAAPDTPGRVQWWEVPYHVGQRWATTIGPAQVTLIADEAGASVLEVDGSPMLASHALVIAVSSEAAQCPQGTEEGEWRLLHALAMHAPRRGPGGSMTAFGPLQRDQWATDAGQSRKLSPTQRFVLARVAAASNMTTLESWRSAQHYANETGFSTKSCSDAIAALIEKGLLSDEGFRARKKCVKLAIPATWTLEGGSNVTLEGGSNVEPPHQKEVPKYIRRRFQSTLEGGSDNPSNYPSNYPSRSSSSVTNEPEPRRSDDDDPVSESEQDEHEVIVSEVASRLAQHDLDERPDHLDPVATPDRWLKATAARRADAHRIEIGAAIACGVTAPAELVAAILANTAPAQAVNGTTRPATVPWAESTNPAVVAERRRLQAVPDLDNDEPHLTREQSRERIRQAKETIKR